MAAGDYGLTAFKNMQDSGIDWSSLPSMSWAQALDYAKTADPSQLIKYSLHDELGGGTLPAWLLRQPGFQGAVDMPNAQSIFFQEDPNDPNNSYAYQAWHYLDPEGGGYSGTIDPDTFTRYKLTPQARAAIASGQMSLLNNSPYEIMDRSGNVIDTRNYTGLKNEDHWDSTIQTLFGLALGGAAMGAAGGGASGAAGAGSGAGFVGEGAASGIGGWDAALANSPSWTSAGGFAGGGAAFNAAQDSQLANAAIEAGGGDALSGYTAAGAPSANAAGGGIWDTIKNGASNLTGSGGSGGVNWLGLGSTALGALAGSQGQQNSATATKSMDPRMDALFYGGLAPGAMGLLGSQMPAAQNAGNQMLQVGSGLLGQSAPTTSTNPYLASVTNDMQRRTQDLLAQNNQAIRGNAVAYGGLGGSRQGVSEGLAASKAADSLQGNIANLYGTQYNNDMNRLLQQQTLGAGLLSQGLDTQWQPLKNTAGVFSPFTGYGTTTQSSDTGGGWMGGLGGALGAAQLGKNLGFWGDSGTSGLAKGAQSAGSYFNSLWG